MTEPRISTHLAPFSPGIDRFAVQGYQPENDSETDQEQELESEE
jgi:hypothetical protein